MESFTNCSSVSSAPGVQGCIYKANLVINPNTFASSGFYTIGVEATSLRGTSWAEVTFEVEERPFGGCCYLNLAKFYNAYETVTVSCDDWTTSDGSFLYYAFYRLTNSVLVPLSVGYSQRNWLDFTLPIGESMIVAEITTSVGASSFSYIDVTAVNNLPTGQSAEQLIAYLYGTNLANIDYDGTSSEILVQQLWHTADLLSANSSFATRSLFDFYGLRQENTRGIYLNYY